MGLLNEKQKEQIRCNNAKRSVEFGDGKFLPPLGQGCSTNQLFYQKKN